jgi:CHAT domain-containing protein/Tfp pilus assembly protein PilF
MQGQTARSRIWSNIASLQEVEVLPASLSAHRSASAPVPTRSLAFVFLGIILLVAAGVLLWRWQRPQELARGVPVERELGGTAVDCYRFTAAAGRYARLRIAQPGADVTADLLDPKGERVADTAGPDGLDAKEVLSLMTRRPGEYRLLVRLRDPKARPGHYQVELEELRPAVASDPDRVAAERAVEEGLRLRGQEKTLPQALARLASAVELWRRIGAAREEVDTLNSLGLARSLAGQIPEALATYEQALARARQVGYRLGEGDVLQNVGQLHYSRDESGPALAAFEDALAAAQTPTQRANALSGIGAVRYQRGDLDGALEIFLRVRALGRATRDKADEARLAGNIAGIYSRRGELQMAVSFYDEALALTDSPESLPYLLHNQASLFLQLGELDRARINYEKALDLFVRNGGSRDWQADCRVGLGRIRYLEKDPRGALAEYDRARTLLPEETPALAWQRAMAYLALGQPERAARLLERTVPRLQAAGQRAREGEIRFSLGTAYADMGRRAAAASSLTRAVELGRQTEYPSLVAPALLRTARLQRDEGRLEEARQSLEEALGILESVRSQVAGNQFRTSFFADKRAYYEDYVDLLLRLDRLHPGKGYVAAALLASERAHARVLLDLLAAGRIDVKQDLPADLRRRDAELDAGLSRTQSALREELAISNPDPARVAALRQERDRLERGRQDLEAEIASRDRRYAAVHSPPLLGLGEIQSLLDEDTALLEYTLGEESSAFFVVTRERVAWYPLPSAAKIGARVSRLGRLLSRPDTVRATVYAQEAWGLYQDLVAPAAALLAGKPRLIIVPDRSLHLLPFEALLTASPAGRLLRDLPYLIREHAVSYVPSASVLASLRGSRAIRPPAERPRFVAFANPALGAGGKAPPAVTRSLVEGNSSWRFAPLPQAEREVEGIAGLYPSGESKVYVGGDAREENVKHNPLVEAAERLHFATHGLLDGRHPELSGLVLAHGNGRDDGFLQAYEIFGLKLSADLVVLSACETLGTEVTGEGVVGLTRAFLYAGAPSVLVSLWRESDTATSDLMIDFYRSLDPADDRAGSLRRAKLEMIANPRRSHPYYWAPFVLVGEPR